MSIHDFYSKLTNATDGSRLFQALRTLSRLEDPKAIVSDDPMTPNTEWAAWPVGSGVASVAAA